MRMLTWELLGAAVGAGLASGREIAAFFGRQGMWGFAGIAAAVAAMMALAPARLPQEWQGRWPERLWRGLRGLLLAATGGAMLAGSGAVAAQVAGAGWISLPVMAGTLLLALILAGRDSPGLARLGRLLLLAMGALLLRTAMLPGGSAPIPKGTPLAALAMGAAYGGFNAALLQPLLDRAEEGACTRRSLLRACALLAGLLCIGLALLLRHGGGGEAPFVALAARTGRGGQLLAALCLYLAALSTLSACLRGLGRGVGALGVAAAAALGFSGVVDAVYPVLGALCASAMALMRAANFLNSCRNTFHSRRGVL